MARKSRTSLNPTQTLTAAQHFMDKQIPVRVICDLLGVSSCCVYGAVKPVLRAAGYTEDEIARRSPDQEEASLL